MARPHRPRLLTPDVHANIIANLRAGNYVEHAASAAGVAKSTVYDWLRKGENAVAKQDAGETLTDGEETYAEFVLAVEEARAYAISNSLELIREAAPKNWQAAAWYLERTAPAFFGRHMRTEITGPNNGPVQVEVTKQELVDELLTLLDSMDDGEDES